MKLKSFLYLLLRDSVQPGEMYRVLAEVQKITGTSEYSSAGLAAVADEILIELLGEEKSNLT